MLHENYVSADFDRGTFSIRVDEIVLVVLVVVTLEEPFRRISLVIVMALSVEECWLNHRSRNLGISCFLTVGMAANLSSAIGTKSISTPHFELLRQ